MTLICFDIDHVVKNNEFCYDAVFYGGGEQNSFLFGALLGSL